MALTRPLLSQLNTNITAFSDNMMVLNAANVANRDIGMVFDRSLSSQSNVTIFWQESSKNFTFALTSSSGLTNTNLIPTSAANISTGNVILANTAGIFYANGSIFGGGGGTPGGSTTQIQFNDVGAFGGNANFTFNKTTGQVLIRNNNAVTDYTGNTAPLNPKQGDEWYYPVTDSVFKYINDGTSSQWVDQSFPTSFATLSTNQILNSGATGTGNIGTAAGSFNTIFAKATSAQYADLAEIYSSDAEYPPGTVVIFGGEKEITISTKSCDTRVAGVISTNPAFIMNDSSSGIPVAFTGRVPGRVLGPVDKGDVLITSDLPGTAQRIGANWQPGCVIGKSLEKIEGTDVKVIEIVVGRF